MHLEGEERSIEGVLLGVVAGHYRLAAAAMVGDGAAYKLDGEQLIPARRVLFVQVLS